MSAHFSHRPFISTASSHWRLAALACLLLLSGCGQSTPSASPSSGSSAQASSPPKVQQKFRIRPPQAGDRTEWSWEGTAPSIFPDGSIENDVPVKGTYVTWVTAASRDEAQGEAEEGDVLVWVHREETRLADPGRQMSADQVLLRYSTLVCVKPDGQTEPILERREVAAIGLGDDKVKEETGGISEVEPGIKDEWSAVYDSGVVQKGITSYGPIRERALKGEKVICLETKEESSNNSKDDSFSFETQGLYSPQIGWVDHKVLQRLPGGREYRLTYTLTSTNIRPLNPEP